MRGLRLEDRMGRRLELYEPTTFDGEKGAVLRSTFVDDAIVVHLDSNQAAILHAKLGEMLGANAEESAEEKFSDRVDRLEEAIETLRKAFAEYAPQAALDALAEAFTAEMAKMKEAIGKPTEPSDLEAPAPNKPMVTRFMPPKSPSPVLEVAFRIFHNGKFVRRQVTIQPVIGIGCDPQESTIALAEDSGVDSLHAVLETLSVSDGLLLTDMGSDLGTLVNGRRVNKRNIGLGDRIRIGDSELYVDSIKPMNTKVVTP